jgi:hypothetical protein
MPVRLAAIAVAVAGVLAAAWILWPRKAASDEDLIRAAVQDMADKAGAKDVSGIVEHVSESYHGEAGDRHELKRYLLGFLLRSNAVAVLPTNVQFLAPITDNRAKVAVVMVLARTPAKTAAEVSPEQLLGSHYLEADFARESDGVWRVVFATRRDATAADLLR